MKSAWVITTWNPYNFGSSFGKLKDKQKFKSEATAYKYGIAKWGSGSYSAIGGWSILKVRY